MSWQFEKLLYSNGFVSTWQGRNAVAGVELLILQSSPATSICLQNVHSILNRLAELSTPLSGVPKVIELRVAKDGTAIIGLNKPSGMLLGQHLLKGAFASEIDLLSFASAHVDVLKALHCAGFTCFVPTPDQILWEPTNGEFCFLGWELIMSATDDRGADLKSAIALWVEWLTGAPPQAILQVDNGSPLWLKTSLGLRSLLSAIWQSPENWTLESVADELAQLKERYLLTDHDLYTQYTLCQPDDLARGLVILDVLQRRYPNCSGLDELLTATTTAYKTRVQSLCKTGQNLVRNLGDYLKSAAFLENACNSMFAEANMRLVARRWLTGVQALQAAVEVLLVDSVRFELEIPLLKILDSAELTDMENTAATLGALITSLRDSDTKKHLMIIRSELEVHRLWNDACIHESEGRIDQALLNLKAALQMMDIIQTRDVAYYQVLTLVTGDLKVKYQILYAAHQDTEEASRLAKSAQNALNNHAFADAVRDARRAAELFRNDPSARLGCLQLARHAELCFQLSNALSQPNERWPIAHVLGCLIIEFPDDAWATEQANQFSHALTQASDDGNMDAMHVLITWSDDKRIRTKMAEFTKRTLADWKSQYKMLALQLKNGRRPADVRATLIQLGELKAKAEGVVSWWPQLGMTDIDSLIHDITMSLQQAYEKQKTQQRLRNEYEQARQRGAPTMSILETAEKSGVELFDEPHCAVALLRAVQEFPIPVQTSATWTLIWNLAITAWQKGDASSATRGFSLVADGREVPEDVKRMAQWCIECLSKQYSLPERLDPEFRVNLTMSPPIVTTDRSAKMNIGDSYNNKLLGIYQFTLEQLTEDTIATRCQQVLKKFNEGNYKEAEKEWSNLDSRQRLATYQKNCINALRVYLDSERDRLLPVAYSRILAMIQSQDQPKKKTQGHSELTKCWSLLEQYCCEQMSSDFQARVKAMLSLPN